jgi:hypothetical protein
MALSLEQVNRLSSTRKAVADSNKDMLYKYFLKCIDCSWEISFYEATGNITLDCTNMRCPICNKGKMKGIKSPLSSK